MKRLIIILGVAFCMTEIHAQHLNGKRAHSMLDEFRKEAREDFENFRKQCMEEFIDFVRNPWKEFKEEAPVPLPKDDEVPPVVIPKEDEDKPVAPKPVVIDDDVVKPQPVQPQPKPVQPIEEVPVPEVKYVSFSFFGTPAQVRFDTANIVHLNGLNGEAVADALGRFTPAAYDNMLFDCLSLRSKLQLSDWAYLQMLRNLSMKVAAGNANDATLLLAYLYMQSGYQMRLATDNQRLYMLYASRHNIFEKSFYIIDGIRYYGVEDMPCSLYISDARFPQEQQMSLLISKSQKLAVSKGSSRTISSMRYKDFKMEVSVNKNLMDFYNTYPTSMLGPDFMTRWAMYANAPMDETVRTQAYPALRNSLKGLSQKEAVERLLNLVQTGFVYEYDDKVWGGDRAFFAEESLFYPYCDCEDRSILLTRLVRDLLGLKCILIYYPGHLASAIEFTESGVQGDYISLGGHRYIVADGTYINAPLGRTMPDMDNKTAKVILLE